MTRVGSVAYRWLQRSTPAAQVHSVFGGVVNLRTRQNELVSLIQPQVAFHPFAISPCDRSFESLEGGDSVQLRDQRIQVTNRDWSQRIDSIQRVDLNVGKSVPSVPVTEIVESLEIFRNHLDQKSHKRGFVSLATNDAPGAMQVGSTARDGVLLKRAFRTLELLQKSNQGQFTDRSLDALVDLAGLGPGFTPSGDDFIVGFIGGLSLVRTSGREREISHFINQIERRTSECVSWFSRQWIQSAGRCQFAQPLKHLLRCFYTNAGKESIEVAVDRLEMLGETSGVDLCAGVYFGTEFGIDSFFKKPAGTHSRSRARV